MVRRRLESLLWVVVAGAVYWRHSAAVAWVVRGWSVNGRNVSAAVRAVPFHSHRRVPIGSFMRV